VSGEIDCDSPGQLLLRNSVRKKHGYVVNPVAYLLGIGNLREAP